MFYIHRVQEDIGIYNCICRALKSFATPPPRPFGQLQYAPFPQRLLDVESNSVPVSKV